MTNRSHKVSLPDYGYPSPHYPTVVERTTAPSNFGRLPEGSIAAADVRLESAKATVQEPMSSRQPIASVAMPSVRHRDATAKSAHGNLIPQLPDNLSGAVALDFPHPLGIDVISNDITVLSANIDTPKPIGGKNSAAVDAPIPSAKYTPAEGQDVSRVSAPRPMETSLAGSSVPQNTTEQRVPPLIDGSRRIQVCHLLLLLHQALK